MLILIRCLPADAVTLTSPFALTTKFNAPRRTHAAGRALHPICFATALEGPAAHH